MNRTLLLTLAMLALVLCVALAAPPAAKGKGKAKPKPAKGDKKSAQHTVAIKSAAKKHAKNVKAGKPTAHKVKLPHMEKEVGHHHVHFIYHTHGKNPHVTGEQAGQVLINKTVKDIESVVHVLGRAAGGLHHEDVLLVVMLSLGYTLEQAHREEKKHIHDNSEIVWYHPVSGAPFKIGGKSGDKKFSHMSFIKQIQHYAEKGHPDHDPKATAGAATPYKLQAFILHERGHHDPHGLQEITVAEIKVEVFDDDHSASEAARQHTEEFHAKDPSLVPNFEVHPEIDDIVKENDKIHAREHHPDAAAFLASDLYDDHEAPSVNSNEVSALLTHDEASVAAHEAAEATAGIEGFGLGDE